MDEGDLQPSPIGVITDDSSEGVHLEMQLLSLWDTCSLMAHLQSSVFKLSKDLIDSIHEEGIVAYTS